VGAAAAEELVVAGSGSDEHEVRTMTDAVTSAATARAFRDWGFRMLTTSRSAASGGGA
jgi:hypothetical protein